MMLLRFPTREDMLRYMLAESLKVKKAETRSAPFFDYPGNLTHGAGSTGNERFT